MDRPGYEEVIQEYGIQWFGLGEGNWDKLSQKWIGKGGFWRLLVGILGWLLEFPSLQWYFAIPKKLKIREEFDLIISIAVPYPVHWGVNRAIRKGCIKGKRWVADCSDPFMLDVLRSRKIPFYFAGFEKSFCRNADYLTVPLEGSKDGYYPEFRNKIKVIPQGFHFEKEQEGLPAYVENKIPTFVYAGAFLPNGRDPRYLITYLSDLDKDFRFYMFTHQKYLAMPYIKEGDNRFVLCDIIPRRELMVFMRKSEFLVNIMNSTPMQLPSKLIDYYMIDRPVLNFQSDNIDEEDKKNIDAFLAGDYSRKFEFRHMEQYHVSNVANAFTALI